MYVAVKGGEAAILNSYQLLAQQRRGDLAVAELSVEHISAAAAPGGGPGHDRGLGLRPPARRTWPSSKAPATGSRAIFRRRAYRATLPRLGLHRRRSTPAAWSRRAACPPPSKTCPGGQVAGPHLRLHPAACWTSALRPSGAGPAAEHAARTPRPSLLRSLSRRRA
jgi:alpha-D-ribose 1-methylphosphonate 5-triphosphate synthase subunit PhnI